MRKRLKRKLEVLIIGVLLPIELLSCGLSPNIELAEGLDKRKLNTDATKGDKYIVKCGENIEASGVVDSNSNLMMSNGARFNVTDMKRNQVVEKLKKIHVMLYTPNGLRVSPDNIETHNKANSADAPKARAAD